MHQAINLLLTLFLCFSLLLPSCQKNSKKNLIRNIVYRLHDENFFSLEPPLIQTREPYPWEDRFLGGHFRITKEFFRCKGSLQNPPLYKKKEGQVIQTFQDCSGKHSLPLKGGKEYVYPTLISILNYLQECTGKRLIITTGHRCRLHNTYADPTAYNFGSKHMIGAEVDFYIEGMEDQPEKIVEMIQSYYKKDLKHQDQKAFTQFDRIKPTNFNVTTPGWQNKEILIKLYLASEGRDSDNLHPYPYLSIQMRYDSIEDKRVTFDPALADHILYE